MKRPKRRWSDNNKHFGPFTWSRSCGSGYGFMLDSGGDDEGVQACSLRLYLGAYVLIVELPNFIPPYRVRHQATTWDAATIARMGRDYYFTSHSREYGLKTFQGDIHVHYGAQTHDSLTDRSRVFFLPWRHWRYVGTSYYGPGGEYLRTFGNGEWEEELKFKNALPTLNFKFEDFDGKVIEAKTLIEERKWLFGKGWCSWLSWFRKQKVRRDLDIQFSEEVGPEKGSWKGGTTGHSIEMLPGELHEEAFRRYCEQEHQSKHRRFRVKYLGRSE